MLDLINRLVIYFSCLCMLVFSEISDITVIVALVILSATLLGLYFDDKKIGCILAGLLVVVSYFQSDFIFGFPVFIYEITELVWQVIEKRDKKDSVISVITGMLWLGLFVNKAIGFNLFYVLSIIVMSVISVMLNVYVHQNISIKQKLIVMRDDSTELNNALREKYKFLQEKQDSEVHVATLKERNRIAREIHDNVGHMLSRSILQVGAASAVNKDEVMSQMLCQIKETLDTAMNNIRNSVHDLRDESIDLNQAVLDIIDKMKEYKVNYEYDIINDVPKELKYCIISIIKEATSNIVKHSDADIVNITIREHPAFYQLLILDNGKCVRDGDGTGMGVDNMKERVESFNGKINISNENGYRIFINIPKNNLM